MSDAPIRFVKFRPDSLYELKGLLGTTLDALGGYYWYDSRPRIGVGVNYNGVGRRRNGLFELLRWREEHAPQATLWELRPDGTKRCVLDSRPGLVRIS